MEFIFNAASLLEAIGLFMLILVFWHLHALIPSRATAIGRILVIGAMGSFGATYLSPFIYSLPFQWTQNLATLLTKHLWLWNLPYMLFSSMITLCLLCLGWHFFAESKRPVIER